MHRRLKYWRGETKAATFLQDFKRINWHKLQKLEDVLVDQMLQKAIDLMSELDELGELDELDDLDE